MGSPDEPCKCCKDGHVVAVAAAVVVSIIQVPLMIFRCQGVRGDNVPRGPQKKKWLVPIRRRRIIIIHQQESSPGEEFCVKHFPSHHYLEIGDTCT